MERVALLTGGNEGDRYALLDRARALVGQRIGCVVAASAVRQTEPWGDFGAERPQPFLNQALLVDTALAPHDVLRHAQAIEAELGRVRGTGNGERGTENGLACSSRGEGFSPRTYHSRTMDIDIIFFGDRVLDEPDLVVPHPMMHLRRFVLEPLDELMPDYRHPGLGLTVHRLLERLNMQEIPTP